MKRLTRIALCLGSLALATSAQAEKGDAFFRVGFQSLNVSDYQVSTGESLALEDLDTHSVNFALEYYVTDQWALSVNVPYVWARFDGDGREYFHDPYILEPPFNETPFVDDGEYHGSWQDITLGARYDAEVGDYLVAPFVNLHWPMRDYPFFGFAVVGNHLWRLQVGLEAGKRFDGTNLYWFGSYSYNFREKVLGHSTDHHRFWLELGYFLDPRFTVKGFVFGKEGKGLASTFENFPVLTDEMWYRHDQLILHNWMQAGAGVDIAIDSDYSLNLSAATMVWGEDVNDLNYNLTVEVVRAF